MKLLVTIFLSVFLLVSCKNANTKQYSEPKLKTHITSGYVVPRDSVSDPEVVEAKKPFPIKLGTPTVVTTGNNIFPVKTPSILTVNPVTFVPGEGDFKLPHTKTLTCKVQPVQLPEIIPVKDPIANDLNPANFTYFKSLQGLKVTTLRDIIQDKHGNLWVATFGSGIFKYDGKFLTYYGKNQGLIHETVFSVFIDREGNLWAGTLEGLSMYDGKFFYNYTTREGLAGNTVYRIAQDKDGSLLCCTNKGLSVIHKSDTQTTITNYSDEQGLRGMILDVDIDMNGTVWIGTLTGLYEWNHKTFTHYSSEGGLSSDNVMCVKIDSKNRAWFGMGKNLVIYDGKKFELYRHPDFPGMFISKIVEDYNGNFWMATVGTGLVRFDGKTFTLLDEKSGLSGLQVYGLFQDRSRQLWAGSMHGGLSLYKGDIFSIFTRNSGLTSNIVNATVQDTSKNFWFATAEGISKYDGQTFTNYSSNEGLPRNTVWCALKDKKGSMWFGMNGQGLVHFRNKDTLELFGTQEGLIDGYVTYMLQDSKENYWFTTDGGGVSKYNGSTFTNYTEKQGLPSNQVEFVMEDSRNNIWFATQKGVSCFNGKTFTNFSVKEGLAAPNCRRILEDSKGRLWIATGGGLSVYDGKKIVNFTEKEGLIHPAVCDLVQDKAGNIWAGTYKGISKIKHSSLHILDSIENYSSHQILKKGFFYNYGYHDGFLGLQCRNHSAYHDNTGKIWWGADKLMVYQPKNDLTDTLAPVTELTRIKLYGADIDWMQMGAVVSDSTGHEKINGKIRDTVLANGVLLQDIYFNGINRWDHLPTELSLPYNNNYLTFSFTGVHLQSKSHITYQYKLEGLESEWSSLTKSTEAVYGNLPPGNYTFKVKSMNQSGSWSPPAEYAFEVRPPWWATWWFRIMALGLIIFSVFLYIKRRERKLRSEKEILERTVELRTKEVVEEKRMVEQQKAVVENQKHIIEEKHKEITDSINYAERIQRSFMATKEILDANLGDYFVLFKPKDVVSGDFFWAAEIERSAEKEDKGRRSKQKQDDNSRYLYVSSNSPNVSSNFSNVSSSLFCLVTADSTGHGVPGAIMSLLNITSLERAIEDYTSPGEILNATRNIIIERLKKDGSAEGGKDGMDCSLTIYDFKNKKLGIAAANNPVWIVRKDEVIEIKPDKMPVGKHDKQHIPFTEHSIDLEPGDVIYTLTDGFPDQFGGEKGKKFMSKNLRELLKKHAHLPMQEQKQLLEETFKTWAGNLEQVDDVCIVGVRL